MSGLSLYCLCRTKHLSEDKKKAFIKAKLDWNIKKVQAKLDFLKELQKIFG